MNLRRLRLDLRFWIRLYYLFLDVFVASLGWEDEWPSHSHFFLLNNSLYLVPSFSTPPHVELDVYIIQRHPVHELVIIFSGGDDTVNCGPSALHSTAAVFMTTLLKACTFSNSLLQGQVYANLRSGLASFVMLLPILRYGSWTQFAIRVDNLSLSIVT